jgi:hypothetical protein
LRELSHPEERERVNRGVGTEKQQEEEEGGRGKQREGEKQYTNVNLIRSIFIDIGGI